MAVVHFENTANTFQVRSPSQDVREAYGQIFAWLGNNLFWLFCLILQLSSSITGYQELRAHLRRLGVESVSAPLWGKLPPADILFFSSLAATDIFYTLCGQVKAFWGETPQLPNSWMTPALLAFAFYRALSLILNANPNVFPFSLEYNQAGYPEPNELNSIRKFMCFQLFSFVACALVAFYRASFEFHEMGPLQYEFLDYYLFAGGLILRTLAFFHPVSLFPFNERKKRVEREVASQLPGP